MDNFRVKSTYRYAVNHTVSNSLLFFWQNLWYVNVSLWKIKFTAIFDVVVFLRYFHPHVFIESSFCDLFWDGKNLWKKFQRNQTTKDHLTWHGMGLIRKMTKNSIFHQHTSIEKIFHAKERSTKRKFKMKNSQKRVVNDILEENVLKVLLKKISLFKNH